MSIRSCLLIREPAAKLRSILDQPG